MRYMSDEKLSKIANDSLEKPSNREAAERELNRRYGENAPGGPKRNTFNSKESERERDGQVPSGGFLGRRTKF